MNRLLCICSCRQSLSQSESHAAQFRHAFHSQQTRVLTASVNSSLHQCDSDTSHATPDICLPLLNSVGSTHISDTPAIGICDVWIRSMVGCTTYLPAATLLLRWSWLFYLTDFFLNTKLDLLTNCSMTWQKLRGSRMPSLVQIRRKLWPVTGNR